MGEATVSTVVQQPVAKVASFAKQWGIPIFSGVAGFAAGDFLNIKGQTSERTTVRTVTVLGFGIDMIQFFSVMVYALVATLIFGFLAGKGSILSMAGRAGGSFFAGAMLRQALDLFNITQTLVEVS